MATLNNIGPILQQKLQKAVRDLPAILVTEAVAWTKDNFTRQGWPGNSFQRWKARSPGTKRNRGRAILIDTGYLKRSIRKIATGPLSATFGTDAPYARAHNSGFRGTVNVKAHRRVKMGMTVRGMQKQKTVVGSGTVKAHQKRMNLPQRRFIGYSPVLQSILRRKAAIHIGRTLKS
ncbi:MAG: phage virion morphogenesis protein [Bacteroidota bacterium]